MTAVPDFLTAVQLAAVAAAAANKRARADGLRWAARCAEMEAVLDDLAVALLPRTDITHLIGNTCEGIDCRHDKGFTPSDYDIFPHLHIDSVLVSAADGRLVLVEDSAVPGAIRVADLEEDHEGIHPDSYGWQVGAPYRTEPPAGFDTADDEVWLDAPALRARVFPLLAPLVDSPVSGGRIADARTATLDAQLDDLADSLHRCLDSEYLFAVGFQRCDGTDCFGPGDSRNPHLHLMSALSRDEQGKLAVFDDALAELPEHLLADDDAWSIPELYRTIPTDGEGPWIDVDVDVWVSTEALCARVTGLG